MHGIPLGSIRKLLFAFTIVLLAGIFVPTTYAQVYLPKVTSAQIGQPALAPGDTLTINFQLAAGSSPANFVGFYYAATNGSGEVIYTRTPVQGVASASVTTEWPDGVYTLVRFDVTDAYGREVSYHSDGSVDHSQVLGAVPASGPALDFASMSFTITGGFPSQPIPPAITSVVRTSPDTLTAGQPITFNVTSVPGSFPIKSGKIWLSAPDSATIFVLDWDGTESVNIPTTPEWLNGIYKILLITVDDGQNTDNAGLGVLSTAQNFTLTGGVAKVIYPALTAVSASGSATLTPGQSRTLDFTVTPGTGGIGYIDFNFVDPSGFTKRVSMANSANGPLTFTIGDDWVDGDYELFTVQIYDLQGRYVTYRTDDQSVNFYPAYSPYPDSHPFNLAALNFQVTGAASGWPFIITQPQSATVQPGDSPQLTVTIGGPPVPARYQWYVGQSGDTSNPIGSNSAVLNLSPLSATTSYWVRMTDTAGSVDSKAATITLGHQGNMPTIIWAPPAAITFGTPLSVAQLDATASVAGAFSYTPVAGTVLAPGEHTLKATFTPADTTNYTTAIDQVAITVNKAAPVIVWATPAAIASGTVLSVTQLNATANIPGAFVYSPSAGSVLDVGTHILKVSFTPDDNFDYSSVSVQVSLAVGQLPPTITSSPQSQVALSGGNTTFTAAASGSPAPTFQWQRDGNDLAGATSAALTLINVQPVNTGLYTAVAASGAAKTVSDTAILGVLTTSKVTGAGQELQPTDIHHPNGNIFDQVLLTGTAEAITADGGQATRTSYIDLDDDIVQVEFSGAGTLSLVLDNPSGPALPVNYNQNVNYMKGNAGIVIVGANETTNVSVFTVGRATAFDPTGTFNFLLPISATNDPAKNGSPLFQGHGSTDYDGIADIAFIAILSTDGRFGGVRTANANYSAAKGLTGLYAPGVQFTGPVYIGNITAFDAATPVIVAGSTTDARITGGNLAQDNGQPVQVSGLTQLKFTDGSDSSGKVLSARTNQAVLQQNGQDVTAQIVVNP